MNELIFNGKNFSEFGAYIASSNFLSGAKKDVTAVVIPGRSGKLMQSNNRFENLTLKTLVYVTGNMKQNMDAMRNYLASCKGYCQYSESLNPMEYRMAAFNTMFNPDAYDANGGTVVLEFDAMPQRFLNTGGNWLAVGSGDSVVNPTMHDAHPIVRIVGAGTVQIGDATITVTRAGTNYIDVDTDLFIAYEGNAKMGEYVSISGDPVLHGNGSTGITYSNVTGVSLKPRWFEI